MKNTDNQNNSAFPIPISDINGQIHFYYEGLTKREYFAAKAMQSYLMLGTLNQEEVKKYSYEIADRMLELETSE
jgi:hypothetical protein